MNCSIMVSVIIVAYKNGVILRNALDSINNYNDIPGLLEVIVVDNSPEGERVDAYVKGKYNYEFRYIEADNKGFGAGNNIGARAAQGTYLAFLNPDIVLIEPIFRTILNKFDENNHIGMLGIQLLNENHKPIMSFKYDFKSSFISRQMIKVRNCLGLFDSRSMYIEGADMFVRRDAFESVGGFDNNIFMYFEESDLIRRMQQTKYPKIIFIKELRMIHLESKCTPDSLFSIEQQLISCKYYGKKHNLDYMKKIRSDYRYYCLTSRLKGNSNSQIKQIYKKALEGK